MTLLVRDEEDIIDWNLRYHLSRGVDHIVLTDNRSTDRTRQIVREFEDAGRLTYLFEPEDDYSQDHWVTRMTELAQENHAADWVIHSDADEFWWPEDGDSLKDALSAVPPETRALEVARSNFRGLPEDDDRPFFSRMVYRERRSRDFLGNPLPPKIAHRALRDPYIHQGNHHVSAAGDAVAAVPFDAVSILHFPARSPAQMRRKIANGGAAYSRNSRLPKSAGAGWRAMYLDLLAGRFERAVEAQFFPRDGSREEFVEDHRLRTYLERI